MAQNLDLGPYNGPLLPPTIQNGVTGLDCNVLLPPVMPVIDTNFMNTYDMDIRLLQTQSSSQPRHDPATQISLPQLFPYQN